ncbi:hypothetical protein BDV29DRAFT_190849 [Aspergillus leporis]|uniref:Uncharacterized protein n=1 Tax=Aspergillus leporis TaxID=41062 RepID=A0A5N5X503_9EURO|nr:hypothetical protein BDV29DRAFT_190849 [Aspergillus leporis]
MAPVSMPPAQETRARLEHFRSLGWLPPNFKPRTLIGIAMVERYWRKYCIQSNQDYVDYLLLEDQAIYMNFFDWIFKTSPKKVLQSYDEYWRRPCQYFGLFARQSVMTIFISRFEAGMFPAERRIPRRTKDKNTLDVGAFCVFRHGSMIVQFATVQLWSAITGTRPGVLLPQNTSLPGDSSSSKRKQNLTFQSDLPRYISVKDLPDSVCYRVSTKFFMHGDYQLAYCPITQVISFAFRDGAFANTDLTREIIWGLRVPKRSSPSRSAGSPRFLTRPSFGVLSAQRFERTTCGYELYPSTQKLGRDARFEDDLGHYNFFAVGPQTKSIVRNFTSQKRQRVLGQSADAVFEKHYQSQFIGRDLQHVVLLRPPQEGPSKLTDTHKRLKREKRELMAEMLFPQLYQRHEAVSREMTKLHKTLATDTREPARKDYFSNAPVLEVDRQIKQLLGEPDVEPCDADSSDDEDWNMPPENYDEDKLLVRRIHVTKDMVTFLGLCEPSRQSNRVDWKSGNENDGPPDHPEESSPPEKRSLPKSPEFLAHANTEHKYDIKIKLCHLPRMPQFSHSDSVFIEASTESETWQGTETPAPSLEFDIANIDPRLMEPDPITVVNSPTNHYNSSPGTERNFYTKEDTGSDIDTD